METIVITSLYSYFEPIKEETKAKEYFKELLKKYSCTELIIGLDSNIDNSIALAALELKNEGYNIKLHCVAPCKDYTSKWMYKADIEIYNQIISKADIAEAISDEYFDVKLVFKRDEYMIDMADKIIAVSDGSIHNSYSYRVSYALDKNKEVILVKSKFL